MSARREIVPAAGRFVPVTLYDLGVRLTMREDRWRGVLVGAVAAAARPGGSVLEVGAGTGTLTGRLRAAVAPSTAVVAVEPDASAKRVADAKLAGLAVDWRTATAERLPLPGASQDAAVVALVLHHLTPSAKRRALAELRRVLRPGGVLVVADFGPPQDVVMRVAFGAIRLLDGRPSTAGHADGIVRRLVAEAGFAGPAVLDRVRTAGGTLELLRATAA